MALRAWIALPAGAAPPSLEVVAGQILPSIWLDDATGIIYIGGEPVSPPSGPGGSPNQLQFNDTGVLGGIPLGSAGWVLVSNGPLAPPTFQASGAGPSFADKETPGGLINGSNVNFTLAHIPSPATSLQLFQNGLLLQAGGGDFTLAGLNLTFVTAPPNGAILQTWYRF